MLSIDCFDAESTELLLLETHLQCACCSSSEDGQLGAKRSYVCEIRLLYYQMQPALCMRFDSGTIVLQPFLPLFYEPRHNCPASTRPCLSLVRVEQHNLTGIPPRVGKVKDKVKATPPPRKEGQNNPQK